MRLVSKLVPTGDANLKALSKSITRLLTTVKDMKKHLNRAWDKLISYLNQNFTVPLNSCSTSHLLSLPHCTSDESGHTSCPVSYSLNSDCRKCANRRIACLLLILLLRQSLLNRIALIINDLSRKKTITIIRSKLTAAKKEITAKDALIKKLQKENLVLKHGSNQSEVRSMRKLLAVKRSKLRKFKISHGLLYKN